MVAATMGYYPAYQFRFAALLIVGITLVYGGLVCITAVRGLGRRRRSAAALNLVALLCQTRRRGRIRSRHASFFGVFAPTS
jgi:hypothetical protein